MMFIFCFAFPKLNLHLESTEKTLKQPKLLQREYVKYEIVSFVANTQFNFK